MTTQADILLDRLVRSMQRGQVYQSLATILVVLVIMASSICYFTAKADRDFNRMMDRIEHLGAKVSGTMCRCRPLTDAIRSVGVTGRGLDGIGEGR